MRKEMGKWNKVIEKMQVNMTNMIEKVNTMSETIETMKKGGFASEGQHKSQGGDDFNWKQSSQGPMDTSTQMNITPSHPLENPVVMEFLESIKQKVGSYLENIEA